MSKQLREEYGAAVLDADAIAHALAEPGNLLWDAFVDRYGKARVLRPDGTLDRAAIADILFRDRAEKRWVDDTAHPLVYQKLLDGLAACTADGRAVAVLDVPLLFEAGWETLPDETWVVCADEGTQLRRLMGRDKISEGRARERMAAQMPLDEKKRLADVVIDNSGTREATKAQVRQAFVRGSAGAWQKGK